MYFQTYPMLSFLYLSCLAFYSFTQPSNGQGLVKIPSIGFEPKLSDGELEPRTEIEVPIETVVDNGVEEDIPVMSKHNNNNALLKAPNIQINISDANASSDLATKYDTANTQGEEYTAIDIIVKQDIAMIGYNSTTNLEIPAFKIDGLEGSNTKHTASITDVYLATESSVSKETASLEPDMTNDSVHMDQTSIFNTDGSIRESIGKITTAEEVSIFQLGFTSESLFETKIQESDLSKDKTTEQGINLHDNSTAENVTHEI